jgi:hypothetical protein
MSKSCSDANKRSFLVSVLLLASCAPEQDPAAKKAEDDRAVAQVEAAQKVKPPLRPITPQPILFADLQKYDLFGAGCAFAPGGSMGAVLLTRPKMAFLKLTDKLVRFGSDPGSAELPFDTVSRYVGREYAASLTRTEDTAAGAKALRFPGRLVVTDPFDQVVYAEDGLIQCQA